MEELSLDSLPGEIIDSILSFIPQYAPITRRVCWLWSRVRKPASTKKLLDLLFEERNIPLFYWLMSQAFSASTKLKQDFSFLASTMDQTTPLFLADRSFNSSLELLEWSRQQWGAVWDKRTNEEALRKGDLPLLDWLKKHSPPQAWKSKGIAQALVKNGSLEMVGWVEKNLVRQRSNFHLSYFAAQNGHMEILKRSYGDFGEGNEKIYVRAASFNQVEVLKWLDEQGETDYGNSAMVEAAIRGALQSLKYLQGVGYNASASLIDAVSEGHEEVVKWIISLGGFRRDDLSYIGYSDNVQLAKHLYEEGYLDKTNVHIWSRALEFLRLSMLVWLKEEGFTPAPLGVATLLKGSPSLLLWAERNQEPLDLNRLRGLIDARPDREEIRTLIETIEKERAQRVLSL